MHGLVSYESLWRRNGQSRQPSQVHEAVHGKMRTEKGQRIVRATFVLRNKRWRSPAYCDRVRQKYASSAATDNLDWLAATRRGRNRECLRRQATWRRGY